MVQEIGVTSFMNVPLKYLSRCISMAREIYFYLKFTDVVKHIVVMVSRTVVMMGFSLIGTTAWTINVVVVVKKLHLTTVLGHVRGTIRTITSKRTRRL